MSVIRWDALALMVVLQACSSSTVTGPDAGYSLGSSTHSSSGASPSSSLASSLPHGTSTQRESSAQSSTRTTASSATDAGDVACGCHGKSGCAVWHDVLVTWYGFNDNSCTVESEHDCNTIAFPGLGPQKHAVATEGTGAYDDPITCAASATNSGGDSESEDGATLAPGTRVYNPEVKKYFIMEDQCAECTSDYLCKPDDDTSPDTKAPAGCTKDAYHHIDFWMGPSFMQDATHLSACEDNSTLGNAYAGTGVVVVNPPDDLPVHLGTLYTGTGAAGGCWTSSQVEAATCP